jgi:hypothetical protein
VQRFAAMLADFRTETVAERSLAGINARVEPSQLSETILKLLHRLWPILQDRGVQSGHNVVIYENEAAGHLDITVGVEVFGAPIQEDDIHAAATPAGHVTSANTRGLGRHTGNWSGGASRRIKEMSVSVGRFTGTGRTTRANDELTCSSCCLPRGLDARRTDDRSSLASGRVFVVHGVCVGQPGVASWIRRRAHCSPISQCSDHEEPNSVRAFAKLRCLGLGLVAVGDENPAWYVPHAPSHPRDANETERLNATSAGPLQLGSD